MKYRTKLLALLVIASALLAACGSGGSSPIDDVPYRARLFLSHEEGLLPEPISGRVTSTHYLSGGTATVEWRVEMGDETLADGFTYSLVGDIGTAVLSQYNVSKGFFGAKGITVKEGLTDADSFEVRFKRAMVETCREAIAVLDASKWGEVAAASFASLEQIGRVFTGAGAPLEMVRALETWGVDVTIVETS